MKNKKPLTPSLNEFTHTFMSANTHSENERGSARATVRAKDNKHDRIECHSRSWTN